MKPTTISIWAVMLLASSLCAQQEDFPVLKGPYLGQKPPGSVLELFASGIISVDENFEHSAAVFSPDGSEVFWCTNVGWFTDQKRPGGLRLYFMKIVDGRWTAPQPAPFVEGVRVERPVFSPDGRSLYFEAYDPSSAGENVDIFVVHRTAGGWSEPEPVSPLINSRAIERLYCVTADGSMYFSRNLMRSDEAVFVSKFVNGAFTEPEELGRAYNSTDPELALVFGPDAKYMLTTTINAQHTSSDLWISYRKADGAWTDRIKLPYYTGGFLALSPDGKYLFMLNEGICWISTSFVEEMKLQQGLID